MCGRSLEEEFLLGSGEFALRCGGEGDCVIVGGGREGGGGLISTDASAYF